MWDTLKSTELLKYNLWAGKSSSGFVWTYRVHLCNKKCCITGRLFFVLYTWRHAPQKRLWQMPDKMKHLKEKTRRWVFLTSTSDMKYWWLESEQMIRQSVLDADWLILHSKLQGLWPLWLGIISDSLVAYNDDYRFTIKSLIYSTFKTATKVGSL